MMDLHSLRQPLEMRYLQRNVQQSHGMVLSGWLEALVQINSPILWMESTGLHQRLEMRYLQLHVSVSPGMVLGGSPAALEQTNSPIPLME